MCRDAVQLIDDALNEDVTYQKKPLELRNQRTYAVKAGVNGLLDVARQTYKEANQDAYELLGNLAGRFYPPRLLVLIVCRPTRHESITEI